MRIIFLHIASLFLLLVVITGCAENQETTSKQFEEIQPEESEIASIIRNPVTADKPLDTVNTARIDFEEKEYDFGTVKEGEVVKHTFKFKNTGKAPLLISDAKSTCGCTVPKWPKEPVPPGKSGEVEVKFNTKNKKQKQDKHVTIISNAYPARAIIKVKGFVEPK